VKYAKMEYQAYYIIFCVLVLAFPVIMSCPSLLNVTNNIIWRPLGKFIIFGHPLQPAFTNVVNKFSFMVFVNNCKINAGRLEI